MRVPYAQHLGKVPFKAVAVVIGVGAAAAAGFAALSWTANASRPVANEPLVRSARVMEIAYQRRSQSLVLAGTVVPRIETNLGFRVAGKIVARTDELEIVVGVPEHRLKAVREARAASFELWSDPGRRHAVRLRELSPSADPMTRTYPARFSVIDPPTFIGLGMTATLAFERPDA